MENKNNIVCGMLHVEKADRVDHNMDADITTPFLATNN